MPVYPGSEPALGVGNSHEGIDRSGVRLLSNDDADTVRDYYESEFRNKGWELTEGEDNQLGTLITASKDGMKTMTFIMASEDGGTDIFQLIEQE